MTKNKHLSLKKANIGRTCRIMRVFFLCLTMGIGVCFSNNSYSQSTKISLNLKNKAVKQVFSEIEKNSEFIFFYQDDILDADRKVTVNADNETIEQILNKVLSVTNNTYFVSDRSIYIIKKASDNIVREEEVVQQRKKQIAGTVTDKDGEAIIGANIVEKGITNGTVTDVDGRFSLNVEDAAVLQVSYIGYLAQDINTIGKSFFEIVLQEDTKSLDELIVVGYGVISRKNLTTSISTVKTDNISKAAASNMSQLLLGRAAGLTATVTSPQPGGNVNLSIRGAGAPIFVVDGVMMPNNSLEIDAGKTGVPSSINRAGLAGLSPTDIESIEILKDASASIYGIGAANGVVLITTKKGKTGKPKVVYDGNFSIVENQSFVTPLNAQDYMNMANVFNKENYLYNHNQYPYGDTPYDNKWIPLFSAVDIANSETTNWLDYIFKAGSISNQNISVTGGSDLFRYYFGGNYYNYEGSVANAGMERFALRTNVSSQLLSFLTLTAIVNVNQNNYKNSSVGGDTGNQGDHGSGALQSALSYPSYLPLRDSNGQYTIYQNFPNPEAMLSINDRTKTNGYYTNLSVDIDIIKNILAVKFLYGINSENANRSVYLPSDLYFGQMYKSRGNLGYNKRKNQTIETTVSFQKEFKEFLRLDAVIGMGKYIEDYSGLAVSYENINNQINNDNIAAADGPFYPSSYKDANEKRSQFARVSTDLLNRYVLSATIRRDGTDKFFPDSKYAYFPSVSFAWKISNENFLQNVSIINLLKIRGSYGQTGSDNLGTTLYGLYSPSENHVKFDGNSVTYIPYLMIGADYPDVGWEKSTMKNIGLDFSICKDRISGSFDLFRNDITRLLGSSPTAPLSMLGTRPINGGHYKREGWDASINTANIQNSKFKWNSLFTFSRYNLLWIKRMPNYDYQEYQKQKNEPINAYYYYNVIGVINIDKSNMPESQKSLPAEAQLPGSSIIEDKDGNGRITIDDIYMDNAVPDIYLGFGNTFVYKNFDLDIFMYGQFGLKKYNYSYAWALPGSLAMLNPPNSNEYAFTIWNSQTNPNGSRPGIASTKTIALPGNANTNRDIQDASFMRVRNITMGYNQVGSKLGSFGKYIDNIRIFADVQNPFIFTGFDGFDPEIKLNGGSKGKAEYPQTRTYSLGLKVTF